MLPRTAGDRAWSRHGMFCRDVAGKTEYSRRHFSCYRCRQGETALKHRLRQGLSAEVTLFVAFMLVIQVLFSGLSLGAKAAALDSSALSHVLCTSDGRAVAAGPATDDAPVAHTIDCCTFGCSMVGGAVPTAPDESAALTNRLRFVTKPAPASPRLVAHVERKPQNPRAPPEQV